jgi:hypothetical protein
MPRTEKGGEGAESDRASLLSRASVAAEVRYGSALALAARTWITRIARTTRIDRMVMVVRRLCFVVRADPIPPDCEKKTPCHTGRRSAAATSMCV